MGASKIPEIVFAGVTFDGLYRTRDAGRHWERVLEGDIRWVTVDPTDDRVIYAGTEPVHLYRSEDGGDSWEEIKSLVEMPEEVKYKWYFPQPPHQGHVRHINIDPENPNVFIWLWSMAESFAASIGAILGRRKRGARIPGYSHGR